jgi:hypothetical protein
MLERVVGRSNGNSHGKFEVLDLPDGYNIQADLKNVVCQIRGSIGVFIPI